MLRRCQEGVRLVLRKCHKKRSGNCLRNFKEEYKKCQGRIEEVSRSVQRALKMCQELIKEVLRMIQKSDTEVLKMC